MLLSKKQRIIISYLRDHNEVSLLKAVELIGSNIYANKSNYVGKTLSRMVNRNVIERKKPGVFILVDPKTSEKRTKTPDLFD